MPAAKYDMQIEQGIPYKISVEYKNPEGLPKDLTGFTGKGQIKKHAWDKQPLASFDVSITDAVNGVVEISLAYDALNKIDFENETVKDKLKGVYDVILINDTTDERIRLVQGNALISAGVTN